MIIDAFPFFNELDILEFRLRLLWPYVDRFVAVEANKTHSGLDKPFFSDDNMLRFQWAQEKLAWHKLSIDLSDPTFFKGTSLDPRKLESFQRNAILAGCADLPGNAIVMISDADEIPSPETVQALSTSLRCPSACRQHLFYYNLRYLRQEPWYGSVFTTLNDCRRLGPQALRDMRNQLTKPYFKGWHLSYFGDANHIQNKIASFSHQELNLPPFLNATHINECIGSGRDLFGRRVGVTRVESSFFPDYFVELAKGYKWGLDDIGTPRATINSATATCAPVEHNAATIASFEVLRADYYHRIAMGPFEPRGECDPSLLASLGSDIVLHLPILEYYASHCAHVTEFGLRNGHSTVALLSGCKGQVHSYDIVRYPIVDALSTWALPCQWCFHQQSSIDRTLNISETDLLFVDSEHTYAHVKAELALHGRKARKWLAFHDTATYGHNGSDGTHGIVQAIGEFVEEYPEEYRTVYRTDHCNGLWVLERLGGGT